MNSNNISVIIQVRLGSMRLPGKILKNLHGKPFLARVVERAQLVKNVTDVIVATTTNSKDSAIEDWCKANGVEVFRGSEPDVLDRYYQCAKKYYVDVIVRITADNVLFDWENVDEMISSHLENNADLTYTEGMPLGAGLGNCVISFNALEKARELSKGTMPDPDDPILEHPELFKINVLHAKYELRRNYRLTVDYPEDFELMEKIFSHFSGIPKLEDVIKYLDENPELVKINEGAGKVARHEFNEHF